MVAALGHAVEESQKTWRKKSGKFSFLGFTHYAAMPYLRIYLAGGSFLTRIAKMRSSSTGEKHCSIGTPFALSKL
ncbi:hypothetical protein [Pseudomonas sp. 65/3-MNA-CIBAN-0223]|uniref:hypothetical protein n=1 Tax=Pseudomonas sp. 65/3-MNA-CIBAN-0223 TaxID=3140476 RepID=UPI00331D232A